MYKDDLARVIDVDYSTGRATIEVVPRIDYAALASKERALPFGRTPTVRPAPRCALLECGVAILLSQADWYPNRRHL
jgi:hypothetical protein